MNNKTFIFIRKHMTLGGIQTYLIRTIRALRKRNCRVIWLAPKGYTVDESFEKDLLDGYVQITEIDLNNIFWIRDLKLNFSDNESVLALSFNLFHFVFLEMIKKKYGHINMDNFFWVPHFKGKEVFLEKFAPKKLQSVFKNYISKIIHDMEKNNNIIYVNKSHLDAFTKNYNYEVEDEESKLLTNHNREVPPFDYNLALKRSKREYFNIITICRFSFPHKAYVLGLIRAYGELKLKYRNLRLIIIGYGPDEDKVKLEINKLNAEIRRDINLVGKVPYDELCKYFKEAHLNIGVAGTIADGAVNGVISIPVRHYSEECEGYGYLPESKKYTTSDIPGIPIKTYIEEVINMSSEQYLELSKESYDTYDTVKQVNNIDQLLLMKNKNSNKTLNKKFIFSIWLFYIIAKKIRSLKQ